MYVRVIAGKARGRKLRAPEGNGTRPITDRAKEGIFNMVGSIIELDGVAVVDLFAGSGSFGIEALSRGAASATFVERDRRARATLTANLETLGFTDRARVVGGSVLHVFDTLPSADLAFCDPPYALGCWDELQQNIRAEFLIGHAETPISVSDSWVELRRRRYGRAHILIAQHSDLNAEGS